MITVNVPILLSKREVDFLTMLATLEEIDEEAGIHLTKYMSYDIKEAITHLINLELIKVDQECSTLITRGRYAGKLRDDGMDIYRITEKGKELISTMQDVEDITVSEDIS